MKRPPLDPVNRITVTLDEEGRRIAHAMIDKMADGWRVEFLRPLRSPAQNRVMWPMLADLSAQVYWYGHWLTDWDWKDVMTASLRKCKVVPTIEHDGLVPLGLHTSEMSDEEFSALLEQIQYFGAREGVVWSAPKWMEEWRAGMRS